jgi:WD40 repeat protein
MRQFQAGKPGTAHDVVSVAISPDGKHLVASVDHEGVFLFTLTGNSPAKALPADVLAFNRVSSHDFLFADDGRIALLNMHGRFTFDPVSDKVRRSPMNTGGAILTQIELSGSRLLTAHGFDRMGVGLWQTNRSAIVWDNVWFFDFRGAFHGVATGFHADRFYLLHGKGPDDTQPLLTVRSFASRELLAEIPFPANSVSRMQAPPDASFVVGMLDATLIVWRPGEKPMKVRPCGRKHIRDLTFHPSGKYLAIVGNDESVRLLDVSTWKPVKQYAWKIGKLRTVAFSPDGTLSVAGGENGQVVVWDVDV